MCLRCVPVRRTGNRILAFAVSCGRGAARVAAECSRAHSSAAPGSAVVGFAGHPEAAYFALPAYSDLNEWAFYPALNSELKRCYSLKSLTR